MLYDTLSANIYAKPIDERIMPTDSLETPKRIVKSGFDKSGKDAKLGIDWADHEWPEPQTAGYRGTKIDDPLSQYRHLQSAKYDADINLLVAKNLHEFGPELGLLLMRRRAALHTFVISLEDLPDRVKEGELYRGISCIPLPGKQDNYSLQTQAEKVGPVDKKNIEQRGHLSFHSFGKISRFKIQNLLQLVYHRKAS